MFKRISHRIALQFTAFVFGLLILTGTIFLAADLVNAHRMERFRLERMAEMIALRLQPGMMHAFLLPRGMPQYLREQVRILDAEGNAVFTGSFFSSMPFTEGIALSAVTVDGQEYAVLTDPFQQDGRRAGFVQIAEHRQSPRGDLSRRAYLYFLVSVAVSLLTYGVGLFFARRSLKPAEQMVERLEQFTQDASHELRSPLAALRSSLDLALKNRKYREGIVSAREDVKEVSALAERLLELARLDRFVFQSSSVDLSALAESSAKKFRPLAAEKGIDLQHAIDPGVTVKGDASLLRQVLGNLLSNAIKFNKSKGKITLRLTKRVLTVEDTGFGIAKKALPHIFDRFYQADASRAKEGYGLGLALVRRIVELHGWSVDVKSVVGVGTVFTVKLS